MYLILFTFLAASMSLCINSLYLVQIKDNRELPGVYGKANFIGGKKVFINERYVSNIMNGNDNNTLVHELGHTLGLRHIDQKSETFFETVF